MKRSNGILCNLLGSSWAETTVGLLIYSQVFCLALMPTGLQAQMPPSTLECRPPADPGDFGIPGEPLEFPRPQFASAVKPRKAAVPRIGERVRWEGFAAAPTTEDISRAPLLPEVLVPVGGTPSASENRALAEALEMFAGREDRDDVSALTDFVQAYPASTWNVSLLANIGKLHYRHGYFSRATAAWEQAARKGALAETAAERLVADDAYGELLRMYSRIGEVDRVEQLLMQAEGREFSGQGAYLVESARQALWGMRNRVDIAFRCGPEALRSICEASSRPELANDPALLGFKSTEQGTSLAQIAEIAQRLGIDYLPVEIGSADELPIPSIVHWSLGHFAAIVGKSGDLYRLQDPTFGNTLFVSRQAIAEESSGNFLIARADLREGWRVLDTAEAGTVWGKGFTTDIEEPNGCGVCTGDSCDGMGMPSYKFQLINAGLILSDTPVGYAPPFGPGVYFTASYRQREAGQPGTFPFANLSPKWNHNWMGWVEIEGYEQQVPGEAIVHLRGGGLEKYQDFDDGTDTWAIQRLSQTVLKRVDTDEFHRVFPSGAVEVYSYPVGDESSPRVLLTSFSDEHGNTVSLVYDDEKLVEIVDPLEQATTLEYEKAGFPFLITSVTDPFSRTATFDYDGSGRLVGITDVLGLTSSFEYDGSSDFIESMTTPYGTTRFEKESGTPTGGGIRFIQATSPNGDRERAEFNQTVPVPLEAAPADVDQYSPSLLTYRNTFYWDKRAMREHAGDYLQATNYHWLHTADGAKALGVPESIKRPLESRVWFGYAGQPWTSFEGSSAQPIWVARKLDDNSTQVSRFTYNSLGQTTTQVDPLGRKTKYTYTEDGRHVTKIEQLTGDPDTYETLAEYSWDGHELEWSKDASGAQTTYTWNTRGQITSITNDFAEVTTYIYSTDGYLTDIENDNETTVLSMTYDTFGRVETVTDVDGYTLAYTYDELDRITSVIFPDDTYTQIVYDRLKPAAVRDRRGRWTRHYYDAEQQLVATRDPQGLLTQFEYCKCGALSSLVDPAGNITRWDYDVQGRLTAKIYPDNSKVQYAYEMKTSRLKTITDAMGQVKTFSWNKDDTLAGIVYSNAAVFTPSVSLTWDTRHPRLTQMTDGTGTTHFGYVPVVADAVWGDGRLAFVSGPLSGDVDKVEYVYDKLGRRATRTINQTTNEHVTFDNLGRIETVENLLGVFNHTYVGDSARIAEVDLIDAFSSTYSWLGANDDFRLEKIEHRNSGSSLLESHAYTYDVDGIIQSWTTRQGTDTPVVNSFRYDNADRLLGAIRTQGAAFVKQWDYTYDRAGNRTSEQNADGASGTVRVTTAAFNGLNELTGTTPTGPMWVRGSLNEPGTVTDGAVTMTTDASDDFEGRLTPDVTGTTATVTLTATDASENVAEAEIWTFQVAAGLDWSTSHDANGNMVSRVDNATSETMAFEWDAEDRLVAVVRDDGETVRRTEFTYDGFGRRVRLQELSAESGTQDWGTDADRRFVWDGLAIAGELSGAGAPVAWFFAGGEHRPGTTPETRLYLRDHLGSVRTVTDDEGAVVARYDFDPYGRRTRTAGSEDVAFGFTGHFTHAGTGLVLAPFRVYDTDLGRWISRDPIGEAAGVNLYGYVENSPVVFLDPFGLWKKYVPWGIGGCIVGGIAGGVIGITAGGSAGAGVGAIAGGIATAPVGGPGALPGAGAGGVVGGTIGGIKGGILGCGVGASAAVLGKATADVIVNVTTADSCPPTKSNCPPCVPPVGTVGYRYDKVPPSRPHHPFTGDHVHLYRMNQDPVTCRCRWSRVGVTAPPPPPGAIPM